MCHDLSQLLSLLLLPGLLLLPLLLLLLVLLLLLLVLPGVLKLEERAGNLELHDGEVATALLWLQPGIQRQGCVLHHRNSGLLMQVSAAVLVCNPLGQTAMLNHTCSTDLRHESRLHVLCSKA